MSPFPRRVLLSPALLLAAATPALPAQDLVAVAWTGEVYRISSTTGGGTQIGRTLFASGHNSLAIDTAGTIWSTQGPRTALNLISIDPTNGSGTVRSGVVPDVRGLAAEADGSFFAVVNVGAVNPNNELWHISTTGFSYRVGNIGYPGLQGLTSVGGALYGFDLPAFGVGVGLVRIDRVTGVATDVNPNIGSPGFDIQFLATRADGKVFGGRDQLYEIDVTTGAYTLIGGGGYLDVRGADFVPCALGYAIACRGSGSVGPELSAPTCFRGGQSASLRVDRGLGGAPGVLLIGQSQTSAHFLGCNIVVGNLFPVTLPLTLGGSGTGSGSWLQSFGIPSGPAATLTFQVGLLDAGAAQGLAMTNCVWIRTQ